MNILNNIDLFSVGIITAANLIIGFVVFLSDKKSITNKLFFSQTIILSLWSIVNYLSYKPYSFEKSLLLVRLVLFFGIPNSINFLLLMYTFPSKTVKINRTTIVSLSLVSLITMAFTLSPLVFKSIILVSGNPPTPIPGLGIIAFMILAILPIIIGGFYLIKNYRNAQRENKKQFLLLLIGILIMFFLIFIFDIGFPIILGNSNFVPLSAVFTFPFIVMTAYAIYKHKLFNIKIGTTVILSIFITTFSFINIIFSKEIDQILLNTTAFIIILLGIFRLLIDTLRLEEANIKLRELDRQKSEFVSFASHQLRSPLTAMKGYASLIVEGDYGPISDDLKSAVSRILESSNTLATVVNDYLNISRIELGTVKYNFKEVDERALVQTVIDELRPTIKTAGLKLSFEVFSNDSYKVLADPDQLKQVITNIIDNSIKYTPQGSVSVSLERKDSKILLSVKDTGIGIAKETIPLLFEKFSRAKGADEVNIRGTGLGLYIAKEIIIAHGGKIWVESEGEGKGSQFYVELNVKA